MITEILMCRPDYFRVEYKINTWMKPGSVDSALALKQWQNLLQKYQEYGLDVKTIKQDKNYPDMVFSADQGLVLPFQKKVLLSNFRHHQRQGETDFYAKYFLDLNFQIEFLPKDVYFEGGGETLFYDTNHYFIAQGFRNSNKAFEYISKNFDIKLTPLELIHPDFYHLDTCLFILNKENCFYYPPAFSDNSKKTIKQIIKNCIPLSDFEARSFVANSVVVGKKVFVHKNQTGFNQKLEKLGYDVIQVDVSEFIKAGGGIHCLTFELSRK
jgi:N-dimethylarginine dimethylaminohydrolase